MQEKYLSQVSPRDLSVRASSIAHPVHYFSHPRYPVQRNHSMSSTRLTFSGSNPLHCLVEDKFCTTLFTITTISQTTTFKTSCNLVFATIIGCKHSYRIITYKRLAVIKPLNELVEVSTHNEGQGYSRISPHLEFLHLTNARWPDQVFEY